MATVSALEHSVPSLAERTVQIEGVLEGAAFEIGRILLEAKNDHPREFMAWVDQSLPFGIDKAERMMAVTKAFASCDPEVQRCLPTGWTVLFELQKLPSERLYRALGNGEVHPDLTVLDAKQLADRSTDIHPDYHPQPGRIPASEPEYHLTTDIVVSELIRLPRADLAVSMEWALKEWLDD